MDHTSKTTSKDLDLGRCSISNDDDDQDVESFKGKEATSNITNYPDWSWDHVRTYVAVRRGDKYSDEQIQSLAKQDIVMLEKSNGHETYGDVETGTLQAAKRIKKINVKVKILFYLNAMVHYGGYAANKNFEEEWAMVDTNNNNKRYLWREKHLSYDHHNAEFQQWWIQRALDIAANDEIDGIFVDGLCKLERGFLPVKNGNAWLDTAKQLRAQLPPGKMLIGNTLRAEMGREGNYKYMRYLDGSYLEGWAHPKNLERTLQLISKALNNGKIIMLNAEPHMDMGKLNEIKSLDERYDYLNTSNSLDFYLGYFLLVVEEHAYISFHHGVDLRPRAKCCFDNTRFEAITRALGKPLRKYINKGDGKYTREFEHLTVHVDIKSQEGQLVVKHANVKDEL